MIIATGTYLKGLIHVGDVSYESGPDNVMPAKSLSESLKSLGVSLEDLRRELLPEFTDVQLTLISLRNRRATSILFLFLLIPTASLKTKFPAM